MDWVKMQIIRLERPIMMKCMNTIEMRSDAYDPEDYHISLGIHIGYGF